MAIAQLDRHVLRTEAEDPERARISAYRSEPRYVLLGEPGIGKSIAFELEAAQAGTQVVTAHDFAEGKRPAGRVVFIDALEEFRIGEAGIDRLRSLIEALKNSDYAQWRIACRAISLPPPDARRLVAELGAYVTLQLDLLDSVERHAVLTSAGEADAREFVERVAKLGAEPLLGNPATLLLLRNTFGGSSVALNTREALLAEATRQMSHELNPDIPERPDRPPPARIEAAAEAASLVLLLSVRSDIWLYSTLPPFPSVTRDDLIEGKIDTEALRAAVDTAMFKGDAAGFQPTHRIVAEYLAGRALARAVAPTDPSIPALPLERALAFLAGDNDGPAPALTGVFGWFVTALARTWLSDRARDLIRLDPEAVLFQGDAAALPTPHRKMLLELVGRSDPWFLGVIRGSSAIGGLAGDDLVDEMRQVLTNPSEPMHRRAMVIEALATGRPIKSLAPDLRAIVLDPANDYYTRQTALRAYFRVEGGAPGIVRQIFDDVASESLNTSAELRTELAAMLVPEGAITAAEVRTVIFGYASTGDQSIGHAHSLEDALARRPMPDLLDAAFLGPVQRGIARDFETRRLLNGVIAATVAAASNLTPERLLDWVRNVGIDAHDHLEPEVQSAIAGWVDRTADGERRLLKAIQVRILSGSDDLWRVDVDFRRLTGRDVSDGLRLALVEAVEMADASTLPEAAELAYYFAGPLEAPDELYWRLVAALEGKPAVAHWYKWLTVCEVDNWRQRRAIDRRDSAVQRDTTDAWQCEWLKARIDRLRDGSLVGALAYACGVYLGYSRRDEPNASGPARISSWLGGDTALIAAVREGWGRHLNATSTTPRAEGQTSTFNRFGTKELIIVAWAEWRWRDGLAVSFNLPLAFRMLRHIHALSEGAEALRDTALARIYLDPDGTEALISFWAGALRLRSTELPEAHYLDPQQAVVREAVRHMLRERRELSEGVLGTLINLAAEGLVPEELLQLAEDALRHEEKPALRRRWAFVAFVISPTTHADLLASDLAGSAGDALFARLWGGPLASIFQVANDTIIARTEVVVSHLGGRHAPPTHRGGIEPVSELIAGMIERLAEQVTEAAGSAIARLLDRPDLAAWNDMLAHARNRQLVAMRAERFSPPSPREVARALVAGPPATAADLRAIVRHTLEELAGDIRNGDTSPWRNFWNRPYGGEPSPKVENDCRDLLTDRVRDRLERYGIHVRRVITESRSASDRRADLLVLGEGAAALPIEAKRHWNPELWTAVEDQLHPYTRSARSNGHGIYVIFWFGISRGRALPTLPGGGIVPDNPAELKKVLQGRLAEEDRGKIEIVIIDVSEPPRGRSRTRKVAAQKAPGRKVPVIRKSGAAKKGQAK